MRGKFILTDLKYFNDPNDSVCTKIISRSHLDNIKERSVEYQINGHLISVEKNDFENGQRIIPENKHSRSSIKPARNKMH